MMKPDPEFDAAKDNAYRVTAGELRQILEGIERIEAERADLASVAKEAFAEAKGRGYSVKVLRKIIARRKRNADDVAEEEAVEQMYMEALGIS